MNRLLFIAIRRLLLKSEGAFQELEVFFRESKGFLGEYEDFFGDTELRLLSENWLKEAEFF